MCIIICHIATFITATANCIIEVFLKLKGMKKPLILQK